MAATRKQIELIEKLQDRGAPIPCDDHGNPDSSMFENIENANAYIKKHGYLMGQHMTKLSASEWGGVLNH